MNKQNHVSKQEKLTTEEYERLKRVLIAQTLSDEVNYLNPCCRQSSMRTDCAYS